MSGLFVAEREPLPHYGISVSPARSAEEIRDDLAARPVPANYGTMSQDERNDFHAEEERKRKARNKQEAARNVSRRAGGYFSQS
jgi:hypothetical protein